MKQPEVFFDKDCYEMDVLACKDAASPSVQKKPERGNLQSSTVPVRGEEGESKEDGGNEKRVL